MMYASLFIKGLVIGFSVAAPVGPIGVLCIRRTLNDGKPAGFLTGLGVASADALYGCIAGFGLTLISNFLLGYKNFIGLFGGLFLCYLGVSTMISTGKTKELSPHAKGLLSTYFSTFLLTLTNPMTILSFIAIFASLGAASATDSLTPVFLISGVFCGSALWWLILTTGTDLVKRKMLKSNISDMNFKIINLISGAVIGVFGLNAILKSIL